MLAITGRLSIILTTNELNHTCLWFRTYTTNKILLTIRWLSPAVRGHERPVCEARVGEIWRTIMQECGSCPMRWHQIYPTRTISFTNLQRWNVQRKTNLCTRFLYAISKFYDLNFNYFLISYYINTKRTFIIGLI